MKLISSTFGTAFLRASADDVCPTQGRLPKDLADFVGDAYQFTSRPIVGPQSVPEMFSVLLFQMGKLERGTESYAIPHLAMFLGGDAATAANTDIADFFLDDFTKRLDAGLGYRYGASQWPRSYMSALVVQFDEGIEKEIAALGKMEAIINQTIPREGKPFKPKTISFGFGDPAPWLGPISLDAVDNADFILQRRTGVPYAENRYFSSAPLRTADHFKMLQAIEEAFRT